MPHCVERTGFSFGYSLPEIAIEPPRSGSSTPEIILMSVDLPDPFSPTMQCTSPTSSLRSTLRSACTPPKRFEIPDNSRKAAKARPVVKVFLRKRINPRCIPGPRGQGNATRARHSSEFGPSASLEPLGDQPVDGLLVDPHDLVDLDLLASDIDRRLAESRDLDTLRDRLAVEHQLCDCNHRVTRVRGIPQETFADSTVCNERFGLA